MEASRRRRSIWWWFWTYFVVNTFHATLFSNVIIGIDHGRSGVTATTPSWFVVRRQELRSRDVPALDNKSLGCCCRNSRPTVINPLNTVYIIDVRGAFIVRRAGLLWSQQDFEWRWSVPLFKCLTVLEFSFILLDLCLLITFFNFIMNYVPIVAFWIFTYHKIWILSIMFCFIWSYWIIYFLACLEVSWRVVS